MSRDQMDLLRSQRDYTWEQEHWFITLSAALDGVTAAGAAWQPPGGVHTIWQVVNHLNYYNQVICCLLTDTPRPPGLPDNDATFGEPGDPSDAAGWQATLERTHRIAGELRRAMAGLSDADLERPVGSTSSLRGELPSWVMHDAYHCGQIVMIRKQQGLWPARREQ